MRTLTDFRFLSYKPKRITLLLQVVTQLYTKNINYSIVENQAYYSKTNCSPGKNNCPVRHAFNALGGKWAFSIVYVLLDGKKRFKELERSIDGINTRMLVKELKSMEENNIVKRTAFPTVPPTVEYALTEKGKKIKPILKELRKWGLEHA